jgi:hypothetical protein
LAKLSQKKLAKLVEFTLEPKKNSKNFPIISVQKETKIVFTIARKYSTISRRAIHHTQEIHLDIRKYTTH